MLSRLRESLALVLLALLPLHALLVTVMTKLIAGPGHHPLPVLAAWKEGVLGVIVLLAMVEMVLFRVRKRVAESGERVVWSVDAIDICILFGIFTAFALEISLHFPLSTLHFPFLLGFKYDFLPLVAFFFLRRVAWSEWFRSAARRTLITVGLLVAAYGITTAFLPLSFFTWLGYSDLHSLYLADGPLAAFQQIGGSALRRIQSTMSGPNQLGLWLIIPLSILFVDIFSERDGRRKKKDGSRLKTLYLLSSVFLLTSLFLTFSRAAWVGAAGMFAVVLWTQSMVPVKKKFQWLGGILAFGACCATILALLFPASILRMQSTSDHLRKPVEAVKILLTHPFGLGLGAAGPASNAVSDTCVQQEAGTDYSWAHDRPNLCVFVGGVQVQPSDRTCSCPLLTENWYLQWAVEMGWVGLILSLLIPIVVMQRLAESGQRTETSSFRVLPATRYALLAFLGLSLSAFFLHSFEDAAVAYTVWVLLSIMFSQRIVSARS